MIKLMALVAAFVCAFYVLGQSQNAWVRLIMLASLCLLVFQLSRLHT